MTSDHWNQHAKQWQHVAHPLRPGHEDVELFEKLISEHAPEKSPLNALLLGVTPELALMQWPENTQLTAIDKNSAMIKHVWPQQQLKISAKAYEGNWLELPFQNNSQQVVVGDGCLTLLSHNKHFHKFFSDVQRVLSSDGVFIIRHFTRPETEESIDTIFDDLNNSRIGNFHIFKWKLAMALHGTIEEGVPVHKIWQQWHQRMINADQLNELTGWSTGSINTINNYKDSPAIYSFPTIHEIMKFSENYFLVDDVYLADYELGDRCPTFVLKQKPL